MNGRQVWLLFSSISLGAGCVFVYIVFTTAMRTGEFSIGAIITAFGLLLWGSIFLILRENLPTTSRNNEGAKVDINWYLTDVFIKFICPCSPDSVQEDDGYMFGRIKCQHCHEIWEISTVSLKPLVKK